VRLDLVRTHGGSRFCFTRIWLPEPVASLLANVPELAAGGRSAATVMGLLDGRLRDPIAHAHQSVTAEGAPGHVSEALCCELGHPTLRADRALLRQARHRAGAGDESLPARAVLLYALAAHSLTDATRVPRPCCSPSSKDELQPHDTCLVNVRGRHRCVLTLLQTSDLYGHLVPPPLYDEPGAPVIDSCGQLARALPIDPQTA
jgi:hypothetical protein